MGRLLYRSILNLSSIPVKKLSFITCLGHVKIVVYRLSDIKIVVNFEIFVQIQICLQKKLFKF